MTATTGALHDALHDLDTADLDTPQGRAHALTTLAYLDREIARIRDHITTRED